jgi:hypothetical protein
VAEQYALRSARSARRVGDRGDVVGAALVDLALEEAGMLLAEDGARCLEIVERLEDAVLVGVHAARVLVRDEPQVRQLVGDGDDLVDLLLVLGDHHRDLRVLEHVGELAGDRVLVQRHRHAAERLRGELRPIEPGAVVAQHRELVAAQSRRSEPGAKLRTCAWHSRHEYDCQMPRSFSRMPVCAELCMCGGAASQSVCGGSSTSLASCLGSPLVPR